MGVLYFDKKGVFKMIIEIKFTDRCIIIDTNDGNIPFEIINGNGDTVAIGNGFDGVTWHALGIINPVWIYEIVCILMNVVYSKRHDEQAIIHALIDYTGSNFKNGGFQK